MTPFLIRCIVDESKASEYAGVYASLSRKYEAGPIPVEVALRFVSITQSKKSGCTPDEAGEWRSATQYWFTGVVSINNSGTRLINSDGRVLD